MSIDDKIVSFSIGGSFEYPAPPFHPSKCYPEFTDSPWFSDELNAENLVYDSVRDVLFSLGMDRDRFGTPYWSPFKGLVREGDHVVLKPNFVTHEHPLGNEGVRAMITHASVLRPLIDYLCLEVNGDLRLTICDVPLQQADWDEIVRVSGVGALVDYFRGKGVGIQLLDLRYEKAITNIEGIIQKRVKLDNDPLGYVAVDLADKSCFVEIEEDSKLLEITDYGKGTASKHHTGLKNEYLISKTVLDSDLFINIPKLKTHKKAGVSLSLKNLIGINGDKSWIAHHRRGVDEFPKFRFKEYFKWYFKYYLKLYFPTSVSTIVFRLYRKFFLGGKSISASNMEHGGSLMEGNWCGNDTIWRAILDLNNIVLYSDKNGIMQDVRQRNYLSVIDGVIGMHREGPMHGVPINCGLILGGRNPVAVDYVAGHLMGFEPMKIPQIKNGFDSKYFKEALKSPEEISIIDEKRFKNINFGFEPSLGWKGYLER